MTLFIWFTNCFHSLPAVDVAAAQHKGPPPDKVRGKEVKESGGNRRRKQKEQGWENTQGEQFYDAVVIVVI